MYRKTESLENAADRLRGPELDSPRLLVIEDDVDLMNVITRMTECLDPNIEVDWAVDIESAVNRLQRRSYEMVLADYYLRGSKCGLSALEPCIEFQPNATFAMMSSMSLEEMWQLSTVQEFPFLRKPFTANECLGFLGAALA